MERSYKAVIKLKSSVIIINVNSDGYFDGDEGVVENSRFLTNATFIQSIF